MDKRMRDYMMMRGGRGRDGRNPYGSRGGYVTTRRPDRNEDYARRGGRDRDYRMDSARNRDYGMDYERMPDYGHGGYYEGEFRGRTGDHARGRDYADYGDYNDYRGRRYDRDYEDRRDYAEDYGGDYRDYGGGYLSEEELKHWESKLYAEMEKSERNMMSSEKIEKRAKELGIKFDNYTDDELAVATLLMYTDYCPTLGKASIDMYIKLAKDFLEDKDAGVRYGEKLAAYFDCIANV